METIHAESNVVATKDPEKKSRGRKPTVYFNSKPIDPKYHVNYYHDITKKDIPFVLIVIRSSRVSIT